MDGWGTGCLRFTSRCSQSLSQSVRERKALLNNPTKYIGGDCKQSKVRVLFCDYTLHLYIRNYTREGFCCTTPSPPSSNSSGEWGLLWTAAGGALVRAHFVASQFHEGGVGQTDTATKVSQEQVLGAFWEWYRYVCWLWYYATESSAVNFRVFPSNNFLKYIERRTPGQLISPSWLMPCFGQ